MITNFLMGKVAKMIAQVPRTPILRRPDEYQMEYEDVSFPASDGVNLEGWYIPAKNRRQKLSFAIIFHQGIDMDMQAILNLGKMLAALKLTSYLNIKHCMTRVTTS